MGSGDVMDWLKLIANSAPKIQNTLKTVCLLGLARFNLMLVNEMFVI